MGVVCVLIIICQGSPGIAQQRAVAGAALEQRILALTEAMTRIEARMAESRQELAELKQQIAALRVSVESGLPASSSAQREAPQAADALASLRDTQTMHEAQIGTLEQTKVESASKYPLKLSGMILMTGFVNTARVDVAETPTIALGGPGSTGATVQQTILGLDANGPHIAGARTHADLRFDLNGGTEGLDYSGGYRMPLLRLRTAHAELNWEHTRAFFALDRPLLNPDNPTSLIAVAQPALAWSGNLWAWNPQVGMSRDVFTTRSGAVRAQASLMDVSDPPSLYSTSQGNTYSPPATAELSRWPGVQVRIGYEEQEEERGLRLGASGYFAPHRTPGSATRFDSWASAVDFRIPFSRFTRFSGNAYYGAGLGGLGGGAFKDYVARTVEGELYVRTLDDRGGWVQWKQIPGQRLEFNEAFGIDNVPAHQLRPYATGTPTSYYNLARNRTITANVIYSPSTYILFSLEYRRIASSYVNAPTLFSDVIGIGAGYKF